MNRGFKFSYSTFIQLLPIYMSVPLEFGGDILIINFVDAQL